MKIFDIIRAKRICKNVSIKECLIAEKKVEDINNKILGRYCGSYEDQISQIITTISVAKKFPNKREFAHIDIGVLFGGSVLAKLSALESVERNNQLVIAIDPFSGYYGKVLDPTSGLEVTLDNFKKNLRKFSVNEDRCLILPKLSTDIEVLNSVKDFNVVSLMIDGDHTFDGIKKDWTNYSKFVIKGGLCIIDDYKENQWPDVTEFVKRVVRKDSNWKEKGVFDTTLILEKL